MSTAVLIGVLLSTGIAQASTGFSDVPAAHPFHDEVAWGADQGIIGGYGDGTYRPTHPVSRQATAAFMYRMAGETTVPWYIADFTDVSTTHPFYEEFSWVQVHGVADGYPDGTFRPADTVTRQAAMVFLYRLAGTPSGNWTNTFSDVPVSHPFHKAISWAAAVGITNGYPDGTFKPTETVTRQAIAAFMSRAPEANVPATPVWFTEHCPTRATLSWDTEQLDRWGADGLTYHRRGLVVVRPGHSGPKTRWIIYHECAHIQQYDEWQAAGGTGSLGEWQPRHCEQFNWDQTDADYRAEDWGADSQYAKFSTVDGCGR